MNPVHAVSDILKHALVGHEKVAIFEARLTTTGTVQIMFLSLHNMNTDKLLKEHLNHHGILWTWLLSSNKVFLTKSHKIPKQHHFPQPASILHVTMSVQYLEYLEQLLKKSTRQAKRYVSEEEVIWLEPVRLTTDLNIHMYSTWQINNVKKTLFTALSVNKIQG